MTYKLHSVYKLFFVKLSRTFFVEPWFILIVPFIGVFVYKSRYIIV